MPSPSWWTKSAQRAEQVRQSAAGVDAMEARIASLEGLVLRAEARAAEDVQRAEELGSALGRAPGTAVARARHSRAARRQAR